MLWLEKDISKVENTLLQWILLATVSWSRDEMEMDDQYFFAGDMPICLLCPAFN